MKGIGGIPDGGCGGIGTDDILVDGCGGGIPIEGGMPPGGGLDIDADVGTKNNQLYDNTMYLSTSNYLLNCFSSCSSCGGVGYDTVRASSPLYATNNRQPVHVSQQRQLTSARNQLCSRVLYA